MFPLLIKLLSEYKNTRRLVTFLILTAFFIAPRIVFAQMVFNEIMYNPAKGGQEWIELFNDGTSDIDLTSPDMRFNDGDNHLLSVSKNGGRGSLILRPGDYALFANDAESLAAASFLSNYSGAIIDTVMSLNNTAYTLKILNTKSGVELASVSYNKDMGGAGNGRSLEWDGAALKEGAVDGGTPGRTNSVLTSSGTPPSAAPSDSSTPAAANSSNNNFASATPSPTLAPSYQYSQDVLINEFLPWPNDGEKEWVELFNAGASTINLSGWQIDDADNSTAPQVIPASTTIAPSEFLVISFNKNTLNNDGDKVRLLWPDDQVVHSILYPKAKQGQSIAKFSGNLWLYTNQPTPGQANKKSFTEKSETISLASAPNSAGQIIAVEETVAIQTGAPKTAATNNKNYIAPTDAPSENNSTANQNAANPNLIAAAAGEPLKNNSGLNTILALGGVILLSAAAAGGLIHFKRQNSVDRENFDD